jgi:hypothetical protein
VNEIELRKHTHCTVCGKPIGHTGLPLFWTVEIKRHGIEMAAVKRQDGLTAMLGGNAQLAQVMGTDEEMTKLLSDVQVTMCYVCAMDFDNALPIAAIEELVVESE